MRVVLGPGASGGPERLSAHVAGLRRRGVEAEAIALPRGRAERAALVFMDQAGPDVVIGGQSFGGRSASLAAVERECRGLLLLSFPLSGRGVERTAHFPRITCPVLMLQGERDRLSPIDQIREYAKLLPDVRLVTFPGAGHTLKEALEPALDEAAAFLKSL